MISSLLFLSGGPPLARLFCGDRTSVPLVQA
jgi:hypothetical protein